MTTSNQYTNGLAREVVVMKNRGMSKRQIMQSLRVTSSFVDQSLADKHKHIVQRETSIDYTGISETGGY